MKNIRYIHRFDVVPMVEEIDLTIGWWDQITARQDTPGSVHHDTKTIFLRWAESQSAYAAFYEIPAVDYPARAALPACSGMIDMLTELMPIRELGRVMVVNLLPGGHIDPHVDEGAYAAHYDRFHLVLEAGEGNVFRVGGESFSGKTGELWWFNNKVEHEVWNHGTQRRLHMIIDAVVPSL